MSWNCLIRTLFRALLLLPLLSFAQSKSSPSVLIQGAERIEPILTSPENHGVTGFAFPHHNGEYPPGKPFAVTRTSGANRIFRLKTEILDPEDVVWSGKANQVYLSMEGIYIWKFGQSPRKLWDGVAAGLAISDDGRLLAFWDLEAKGDSDELVIFDVVAKKELRRWEVKDRYAKDKHYHSLLFSADGEVIYARTFEDEDTRPLTL